jgi:hypothetical protein
MGDGITALFAPVAHEDHAVRACIAALCMQYSVRRYSDGHRNLRFHFECSPTTNSARRMAFIPFISIGIVQFVDRSCVVK